MGDKYSKTIKCIKLNRSLYRLRHFFRTTDFTNNCAQIQFLNTKLDLMLCLGLNAQSGFFLGKEFDILQGHSHFQLNVTCM